MNVLTAQLAHCCREFRNAEKWLLAPSRRTGYQWVDAVIRTGVSAVNVRIKTLKSLAVEWSEPASREGKKLLTGLAGRYMVGLLWHKLSEKYQAHKQPEGYLWTLNPSPSLFAALYRALQDLRLAGLTPSRLTRVKLESRLKSRELAELFEAYEAELRTSGQLDDADVYQSATARLKKDPSIVDPEGRILVPADLRPAGWAGRFLQALPARQIVRLAVDLPFQPDRDQTPELFSAQNDLDALRWLPDPARAPRSRNDSTVRLFTAIGETNEVREVFRRIVAGGWSLDSVELVCCDESYLSPIYETARRLRASSESQEDQEPALPDGRSRGEGLPITFAPGLSSGYTRPGRALAGWLQWIREDCPQELFLRLLADGLLGIPAAEAGVFSFAEMARHLSTVRIYSGRERYLVRLQEEIEAGRKQIAWAAQVVDDDGEPLPSNRIEGQRRRVQALQLLADFLGRLLEITPARSDPPLKVLAGAHGFLHDYARAGNEMDQFARQALLEKIQEARDLQASQPDLDLLDVRAWLANLPQETRIEGSGPRPGHLHVALLDTGGHTGRAHTLVVGLDDRRFPGSVTPDPLLLDSEREALSEQLPVSTGRLREKLESFYRLMARLRGTVDLSFSSRDLLDDREQFPSPVLLAAYRILSGEHEGDQTSLLNWLGRPASFVTPDPAHSLDAGEWWLSHLTVPERIVNLEALQAQFFPHLVRGQEADRNRQSNLFTVHDGLLPETRAELDPDGPAGPVLSSSRLDTLGTCPLRYFFKYVLGVQPPQEVTLEPNRWLDPLSYGLLLHEVFRSFLAEAIRENRLPLVYTRDHARLRELLEAEVEHYRALFPPPSEAVYRQQRRQLEQAIHIFLTEEAQASADSRPVYLEAVLGMNRDADDRENATPLDTGQDQPVRVSLSNGRSIRVRGRLDRVDRRLDGPTNRYVIWDYKTGSAFRFTKPDPFWQGRVVQHWLYLTMADRVLKDQLGPSASVDSFGYFFPTWREAGRRLVWTPQQLAHGASILQRLCAIPTAGAFLATTEPKDCAWCDYRAVCCDVVRVTERAQKKLADPANEKLNAFRELRRHEK